ncbi:hypothetical protein HT576_08745 [Haloterrigena sp. SYSU A121-1]|uniref:Uncharacterized protein n=1 Tax=Haloterrigena gelatinilytica TaxID=2741724 RepID=A0A8J8KFK4_9EURY|nr:hypothetical protein [Haloterrigena gelatinilytica]NUB91107.1 hypothetical protein [Haloterrigena gelatinilytica]
MPNVCEIHIGSRQLAAVSTALLIGVVLLFSFTDAGMYVRFALSQPTGSLSLAETAGNETDADLYWKMEQVELMNEVSSESLGVRPRSSERLYCFTIIDNRVSDFRLADTIVESDMHSVSGKCSNGVSLRGRQYGILHTHPYYNSELSDEDRSIESSQISVTCIQFDEVNEIGGGVYGVNCWKVVREDSEKLAFEKINLSIISNPE